MAGTFDDFTPWAVWREYGAQKAALDAAPTHCCAPTYEMYVEAIAGELGVGVEPSQLTPAQREAQARAVAKWGDR